MSKSNQMPDLGEQPVSYGLVHDPWKFLLLLFGARPNYKADPKYSQSITAAATWIPGHYQSGDSAELLLKYAEAKYDRTLKAFNDCEKKRDEFMKLGFGLLTGMLAVFGILKMPPSGLMGFTLGSLGVSLLVLLLSRLSVHVVTEPPIQAIRETIAAVSNPHDWFAAIWHQAERGLQVAIDIRTSQLNVAIWWMACSVVLFVSVLLSR